MAEHDAFTPQQKDAYKHSYDEAFSSIAYSDSGSVVFDPKLLKEFDQAIGLKNGVQLPPEIKLAKREGEIDGLGNGFATLVIKEADKNDVSISGLAKSWRQVQEEQPADADMTKTKPFQYALPAVAFMELSQNFDHIHNSRLSSKLTEDELRTFTDQSKHDPLEQAALDFALKNFDHVTTFAGGHGGLTESDLVSGRVKFAKLTRDLSYLSIDKPTDESEKTTHSDDSGWIRLPDPDAPIEHLDSRAEKAFRYLDAHFDQLKEDGYDGLSKHSIAHQADLLKAKDAEAHPGVSSSSETGSEEQKVLLDIEKHFSWFENRDSADGPRTYGLVGFKTNTDGITRKDIAAGLKSISEIHDQVNKIKAQLGGWNY